jgi:hypothetical protein
MQGRSSIPRGRRPWHHHAGIRVGRAGASDEVIRRRLLVPRPYYAITVQRVDRPSAEHHSSIGQPGGPFDPEIGEDV